MKDFFCSICYEEHSVEDIFIVTRCNHKICRTAARHSMLSDIKSNTVPIGCPICKAKRCENCEKQAKATSNTPYCLIHENDIALILTSKEMQKYQKAMLNKVVRTSSGNIVKCINEYCHAIYEKDPTNPKIDCIVCQQSFCANCGCPWHNLMSCQENRNMVRNSLTNDHFENLKHDGLLKICPSCNAYCEKESFDDCNCVKCINCEQYFCWVCEKTLNHYDDPHSHYSEQGLCYGKCFEGLPGH